MVNFIMILVSTPIVSLEEMKLFNLLSHLNYTFILLNKCINDYIYDRSTDGYSPGKSLPPATCSGSVCCIIGVFLTIESNIELSKRPLAPYNIIAVASDLHPSL